VSRKSKGPRLYLRERRGRDAVYVILDGKDEVGTGCGRDGRAGAEKALADYIAKKHKPDWLTGHPAEVAVADVLAFYGAEKAPTLVHPELVGYHLTPLLKHFGNSTCWQVDGDSTADQAIIAESVATGAGRGAASPALLVTSSAPMPILSETGRPDLVGVGGGTKSK
jgi:hypothetical protein